ncbi:MAG TPA: helix-turn-helix domain-containing protein, partial [Thermoanaerobaculia bacterium]|nr:helix-turn-helix domain-containing protein [Thermoanaerobaculia bacterium]
METGVTNAELGLLVRWLRGLRDWSQVELAATAGLDASSIVRYESGQTRPSPRALERIAAAVGLPLPWVDAVLLPVLRTACAAIAHPTVPATLSDDDAGDLQRIVDSLDRALVAAGRLALTSVASCALAPAVTPAQAREAMPDPSPHDRAAVTGLWAQLASRPAAERRRMVETSPEFHGWALVERLCHESEEAASDSAALALELAELALLVAALTPGTEPWRSRLLGYAFAFLANARRVGNDLDGAEEALASAWRLWQAGAAAPGP